MLIQDFLLGSCRKNPDAEALVSGTFRATYADVTDAALSLAASLVAEGLQPGDRVAVLTDVPFDYIVSYFGTLLAGGVFVGLNTQTSSRTLKQLLSDCGASIVVTHRKFLKYFESMADGVPSLICVVIAGGGTVVGVSNRIFAGLIAKRNDNIALLPTREPANLAQIIYTSGTTGTPKGVMLSHTNLVVNTHSTLQYLGLTGSDRVMVVLPFFYSYGNSVLLTHIAVGGALIVNQSMMYPTVILDQMQTERVTGFSGVPSTFALLLKRTAIRDSPLPQLRYVTQAGGWMSPSLTRELIAALPEVAIHVMYGQTEAAPRLSSLDPADLQRKAGSIGKAIPGVTLKVLTPTGAAVKPGETGELAAKGENVMIGYWGQPQATAEVLRDGWLWTGDLVTADEEGYLYIAGRQSDMIKSGAHRIAPKEIEDVLLEHDAVFEVAVIGVDDEILGESLQACVVLKEAGSCQAEELLRHCQQILPHYKVPHSIMFFDELPKTESGKIRKTELMAGILSLQEDP
ncbi:MAG: acyl--CoA ligase [Geobacteraceae bacterium]|nr:acyl--CoA ligase [Geobacteraceae bacterium]NTW79759.1 acyl--CoA ligase [Geobacteraceae bacterium]